MAIIKYLNLLFLIMLLTSCSNIFNENLSKTLKVFLNPTNNIIKTFNRQELKNINYPLIEVRTNGVVKQVLMLPLTIRNQFYNYTSGSGQQLVMHGAMISKTKGMGTNLVSLELNKSSPFLIKTKPNLWANETKRIYGFLSTLNSIEKYSFSCTIDILGKEVITIVEIDYNLTKINENCKSNETLFSNTYWVSDDGFVWKSKQWISPKNIYAEIYIIKPVS